MPTKAEPGIAEMSQAVCGALEPQPKPPENDPHNQYSSKRLWYRVLLADSDQYYPRHLWKDDQSRIMEALLKQDPERWRAYGKALAYELFGRDETLFEFEEIADIATASPEQRLRSAYRALRGE